MTGGPCVVSQSCDMPHGLLTDGSGECFTDGNQQRAAMRGAHARRDGLQSAPLEGPHEWAVDLERGPSPAIREEAPLVAAVDVDGFYRDVLHELGVLAQSGGTAIGAAVVVKRVALAHGFDVAERVPLPRLNRAELAAFGRTGVSRLRARGAVPRGR